MEFIGYKKCTTCIKMEKIMEEKGLDYNYREIDKDKPSIKELKNWHKKSGIDINKFFNTHGKIYREKNLKDKLKDMSTDEKFELLASDGMIVKRPILLNGNKVLVGNDVKKYLESL